ncbi:hypothetical protein CXF83_09960 [Shewanella sp. Choline-02u-19]|uniref:helix-turn-helix domain-containing protein n=1 Tax=unclassified Shewanella TaxID=196818 RepID=UPI000C324039|nr:MULTISPECIES: helix-turn-helix domain-containing protein [unclassified Shewanella]PKH59154.1 hypothetical protein CXF84_03570 [Shewanella sp. Bg11-22]PKI27029.1 hypothetical protein CXF83_09960 [Shewanella sp. Choline-02u-19]
MLQQLNRMTLSEFNIWYENLTQRIQQLDNAEIEGTKSTTNNEEMSLKDAAERLGLSPSALRQRIKHPKKPMPKDIVWIQERPGADIYVNCKQLEAHL